MHASTVSVARPATQPALASTSDQVGVMGVAYERIHPSTCHVISALFPPHTCGGAFFLGLLANAVVKQYALPGLPEGVRGDAAVISLTQGCAELSRRVGLSYDTTHMYLVIYHALGLLYIEKQGKRTAIILPLDAYQPPARLADILRHLQERYRVRRPRVRRLVNHVVEQMGALLQAEREQDLPEQPPSHAELLARVQRVLRAEGVADLNGRLAMSIVTEITPFVSAHAEQPIPSQGVQEVQASLPHLSQGDSPEYTALLSESTTCGSSQGEERQLTRNLAGTVPDGRSGGSAASMVGAQGGAHGRFAAMNLPSLSRGREGESGGTPEAVATSTKPARFQGRNLPVGQQTGEEIGSACAGHARFGAENLPLSRRAGEPFQAVSRLIDANLPIRVDSAQILPFNGSGVGKKEKKKTLHAVPDSVPVLPAAAFDREQLLSEVPLPRAPSPMRHQARALARLIEGGEENVGAYVALLKQYSPLVMRAAVIATLLRKHFPHGKGALKKPGGYFTRRVQQFQQAVPEQLLALVETYAQASYEDIDAALGAQAHAHARQQLADLTPSREVPHPWRGEAMDREVAEVLSRRIAEEDTYIQVMGAWRVHGDRYVVKVFIGQVEHCFCSVEDWEDYHAEMQAFDQEEVL